MKILVALDNEIINKKIHEKYKDEVYPQDIIYMEGVIEFLSKINENYIVITKDTLSGNLTDKLYAKQLKLANPNSKIIYIVNKLTNEYKEFLFANEIFNIIEGETLIIDQIVESIQEDKKVVYKILEKTSENLKNKLGEPVINYKIENQIISKQNIAIYGTSGSGKSFVASIISKNIVKKLNISLALLDMDIQNPSIDILNNISCNINSLSKIVEDVDKKIDINLGLEKYMLRDKDNKNLFYMTNNISLFESQNKLSNKYYEKIYCSINSEYDYTVIDLPASPFLDVVPYTLINATKIFFVINPNYTSIRQAIKYLDLLTKLWDIQNGKIYLIVNKIQKNSLENDQIESILRGYKIVANIEYNKDMESYINGAQGNINFDLNCNKIYESLGLDKKEKDSKKFKIIRSGLFNKKELEKIYDN